MTFKPRCLDYSLSKFLEELSASGSNSKSGGAWNIRGGEEDLIFPSPGRGLITYPARMIREGFRRYHNIYMKPTSGSKRRLITKQMAQETVHVTSLYNPNRKTTTGHPSPAMIQEGALGNLDYAVNIDPAKTTSSGEGQGSTKNGNVLGRYGTKSTTQGRVG